MLVINNYGGMSNLELGALTDETMIQLGASITEKPSCRHHNSRARINRYISVSLEVGYQARQDTHGHFRDFSQCTGVFYLIVQPFGRLERIGRLRRRAPGAFGRSDNSCRMAEFDSTQCTSD